MKRLIEQIFPSEHISASCKREKSVRQGHISTLQTWWARRPLAMCRATIFLSLMPSLEEVSSSAEAQSILAKIYPELEKADAKLLKLVSEMSDFDNSNNEKLLKVCKKLISIFHKSPSLLDSFSGGGSIPLEGLRLGLKTYASELNPIAITGLMLSLNLAPGITESAILRLKEDISFVSNYISEDLEDIYPSKDDLAFFWARTFKCPKCDNSSPLFQNKWLSKNTIKAAFKIQVADGNIRFEIYEPEKKSEFQDADTGTISGKNATCLFCNSNVTSDELKKQGVNGILDELLYAKLTKIHGKKTYLPIEKNEIINKKNISSNSIDFDLPLDMNGIRHLWAMQYGISNIRNLFNDRQKESLNSICSAIVHRHDHIKKTSLTDSEAAFRMFSLLMIMNKVSVYSNKHSWWQSSGGFPANIFVRQAISMVWNYVEIPPTSKGAGGWTSSSQWILKALDHLRKIEGKAEVISADAEKIPLADSSVNLVVIDPPYFDSITYAYLSDFFYPWTKKIVGSYLPLLFESDSTPKDQELIVDRTHKLAPNPKTQSFFIAKMASCLIEARRILEPSGLIVLMYGHKKIDAWCALFEAIKKAGLGLTASWIINSERQAKFRHGKVNALGFSCILVLRENGVERQAISFSNFLERISRRLLTVKSGEATIANEEARRMSYFPYILDEFSNFDIYDDNGDKISLEHLIKSTELFN